VVVVGDATSQPSSSAASSQPRIQMSEIDFINLLVTQMKYQDPMKPLDNHEFMGQMAQFALLNEAKAQNEALAGVKERLEDLGMLNSGILEGLVYLGGIGNMGHALELVGRTVKVQVGPGEEITTVLAVRLKETGPVLETALGEVALPDILEVYGRGSQVEEAVADAPED